MLYQNATLSSGTHVVDPDTPAPIDPELGTLIARGHAEVDDTTSYGKRVWSGEMFEQAWSEAEAAKDLAEPDMAEFVDV